MKDTNRSHLLDKLEEFEQKGYTDPLRFEEGKLLNCENRKYYDIDDVRHLEERRFEGMTNPSDMSILFIVEFDDGRKGTLAAAYGAQANADIFEFMSTAEKRISSGKPHRE